MILIDTGPLVALADKGQGEMHDKYVSIVKQLSGSLITTWSCLTEAMHFLHGLRGWQGQTGLWRYVTDGELILHAPINDEFIRVCELMKQYRDTPLACR